MGMKAPVTDCDATPAAKRESAKRAEFEERAAVMSDFLEARFSAEEDCRIEVRSLPEKGKGKTAALSKTSTYKRIDDIARAAVSWNKAGRNVYYCGNPIRPDYRDNPGDAVKDADILRRIHFTLDADAIKGQGNTDKPATLEQLRNAYEGGNAVVTSLYLGFDWPESPVVVMTGNGGQFTYDIDLPADDETYNLIGRAYEAIAYIHPQEKYGAIIDPSMKNASRLLRLPETMNFKPGATAELPNREAELRLMPEVREILTREKIQAVIDTADLMRAELKAEREAIVSADEPEPPKAKPSAREAVFALISTSAEESYVRGALVRESDKLRTTTTMRHNRARASARAIGGFIHLDLVPRSEMKKLLIDAAIETGLPEKEAEAVVEWGLVSGEASPRQIPVSKTWTKNGQAGGNGTGPHTNGTDHHAGDKSDGSDQRAGSGDEGKNGNNEKNPGGNGRAEHNGQAQHDYAALTDAELGIVWGYTVAPQSVSHLWKERIYRGKFSLFAGNGSDGKSTLVAKIVAAITASDTAFFPDGSRCDDPGVCIVMAAEDGMRDTVKPRLMAAGADDSRFLFLTAKVTMKKGETTYISLKSFQDLDYWQAVLSKIPNVRVIVADPIPAYLGRGVNDHKNSEVRSVMEPFLDMLDERGISLVGITHTGKSTDSRTPAHKILGSVAYSNLARSVHLTDRDPENRDRRMLFHVKNNLGPEQKTLAYRIEEKMVEHEGELIRSSHAVFEAEALDITADEVMNAPRGEGARRGPTPEKTEAAAVWLFDYLTDQKKPVPLGGILNAAGEAGLVGVKKPDGKWSIPAAIYRAKDAISGLADPRADYCVAETKIRMGSGGREILHWYLANQGAF